MSLERIHEFLKNNILLNEYNQVQDSIHQYHQHSKNKFDILILVVIAGFFINLISSALYDILTNKINSIIQFQISTISIFLLLVYYFFYEFFTSKYIPKYPTLSVIVKLEEIQKWGFELDIALKKAFRLCQIDDDFMIMVYDKISNYFEKHDNYKKGSSIQLYELLSIESNLMGKKFIFSELSSLSKSKLCIEVFPLASKLIKNKYYYHNIQLTFEYIVENPFYSKSDETVDYFYKYMIHSVIWHAANSLCQSLNTTWSELHRLENI